MTTELIVAAVSLTALEIVLGIDNLIFLSVLVSKLKAEEQPRARITGLGMALFMRLGLLAGIVWIASLTAPLFTIMDQGFNARDLIMIAGGLFLLYKATDEIHERLEVDVEDRDTATLKNTFGKVVIQVAIINLVFSLDSIVTAIGMTDNVMVMAFAVIVSTIIMVIAAKPLGNFMHNHPSLVMLSFGFLVMIGATLIAEGFGVHVPKEIIYGSMAFATAMEMINIWARKSARKKIELKARFAIKEHP